MQKLKNKKITIILIAVVSFIAVIVILEKTKVTDFYTSKQSTPTENEKTTSKTQTAQNDFTGADAREPGNTLNEQKGTGIVHDNNGQASKPVDTSNPTVSKTGEITLFSPRQNALVTNGTEINGASTLKKVSYRLIDDVSGVISMGELSVINGKYSGILDFRTSAQDGRLDIYGTRIDGSEFSNVEQQVRFK